MTGRTFQRQGGFVLAKQREFGLLIVIEVRLLLVTFVMASLALDAEFTLVRLVVVFLVARDTSHL